MNNYHKYEYALKGKSNYIFWLALIIVFVFLDFHHILFLRPQGIHFIRQTDSLSFVSNYFKNEFHFFNPQVFSLVSTEGRAACEFPILYYVTAILYSIFNEQEYFLRLITLSISSFGFFYLFRLMKIYLNNHFLAGVFTFIFLSSTVLLYYTNNFLPDPSALGLVLIGWYYYVLFTIENKVKHIVSSFGFFTVSSLLKVTYFINPISAITSILIMEFLKSKKIVSVIKNFKVPILLFTISLSIVYLWNTYVIWYNYKNNNSYFLTHTLPIWSMSEGQILEVINYISNYWYTKYYYESTIHFFLATSVLGIVLIRFANKAILIPASFLVFGSVCFTLLFFSQFKDHDYYFITIIPAIIFIILSSFISIKNKFPRIFKSPFLKIGLTVICFLSLNYARNKISDRYKKSDDVISRIGISLSETRSFLDSQGINEDAKFIVMNDKTPNGGLYFINRQGWSIPDSSENSFKKLNTYISEGADYILTVDEPHSRILEAGELIGMNQGVYLIKIKKSL
jgi:hypothetical protein